MIECPFFLFSFVLSCQGKPLPKTEQKFENFVKSSFKISDKKVSHCESVDKLCKGLFTADGFESPNYAASEILC